jgi:hypothetical protein
MAALDFGMAKARGLLPPIAEFEAEIVKRAGGKNIFKSEDWWSNQYNTLIKEGMPGKEKTRTEYLTRTSVGPFITEKYMPKPSNIMEPYPQGTVFTGGYGTPRRPVTRQVGTGEFEQRNMSQAELDKTVAQLKRQTERIKSEGAKERASRKRLTRGTGGLLAKAPIPGTEGMATGLPILGKGGLGIGSTMLGQRQKL